MIPYIVRGITLIVFLLIFSRFHPSATQKITESLYVVRCGFVNFYVLNTSDGIVLFDTGISAAIAKRGLKKLEIAPDEVTHIFLTHTDYDHVGGLAAFSQAQRYISSAEEQMINGETPRRGFIHNRRFTPYRTMEDGEIVVVGNTEIKIYVTPGHTTGSTSFLIDGRYFVSGDLLNISRKGTILPFLWLMNMKHSQDIQSVEAIRPVIKDAEFILTGHTGFYKVTSLSKI